MLVPFSHHSLWILLLQTTVEGRFEPVSVQLGGRKEGGGWEAPRGSVDALAVAQEEDGPGGGDGYDGPCGEARSGARPLRHRGARHRSLLKSESLVLCDDMELYVSCLADAL